MKIGVDATCWDNKRGYGRFTRELLNELVQIDQANEYLFFMDQNGAKLFDLPKTVRKIVANTDQSPIVAAAAGKNRTIRDIWAMSREVMRHKVDLFFFPTMYSYFPIFNRTKIVVTVHDMITENHPELTFPDTQSRYFWKLKQSIAIRQASIVATVSEYSKSQIQFRCKVPNSRMRIISEAADPIFKVLNGDFQHDLLKRFDLKAGELFLLYVGGISPHKNLSNLIKAFAQIRAKTSQNIRLLLVGDYKDDPFLSAFPALAAEVKKLDLDESVSFTGFVSDVELVHLYNAATVMVFPSLDEGFGLPAIEAMACGTPVAASDRGSLKEVLQDAGVYFDPTNITEMVNVVVSILENAQKRDSMRKSGLLRAGDFQWNKSAKDALAIFQEIVSN